MSRSVVLYLEEQDQRILEEELLLENFLDRIKERFSDLNFQKNLLTRIDNFKETAKKNINSLEKKLKDYNIDVDKIKQIVNISTSNLIKRINSTTDPKVGGDLLSKEIAGVFGTVKNAGFFKNAERVGKGILIALGLFIIVLFINSFLLMLFSSYAMGLGLSIKAAQTIGIAICAIFVAPLTEEFSKYLSVKYDSTGQFWFIFNSFEFITYVVQMVAMGIPLFIASFVRVITVLLHTITTYIMYKFRKDAQALNPEIQDSKLPLIIGILIHFFWNLGAVLLGLTFG